MPAYGFWRFCLADFQFYGSFNLMISDKFLRFFGETLKFLRIDDLQELIFSVDFCVNYFLGNLLDENQFLR